MQKNGVGPILFCVAYIRKNLRCTEHIAGQNHLDIDKEFTRVWDHEWEQFLGYFNSVIHQNEVFFDFKDKLISKYAQAKTCLKEISKHWPQFDIDGMRNVWIMKPGNKCRGRGIQLIKNIADVDRIMGLKVKYVVQKYIEQPLIIYKTKFDIRQWFMVTNVQPLTIWMYRDSYLRFSSQIFTLDNFHESLHLTNHAVQCKYSNGQQRDKALPDDNMWDCHTFKAYLKQIGCMDKWNQVIFPGMKQSIICAMLASQDTMDRRPNTYEIYGADFILSEDFSPWLLEINCSPDLSFSTSVTSRLCPQCMEDIVKVMVDRRKDSNADTGLFEMIYKQNYPKTPPYLGMNLSVRGRKMFRNKPKPVRFESKEIRERSGLSSSKARRRMDFKDAKPETLNDVIASKALPKLLSPELYKGPVIEDLMDELQKTILEIDNGIRYVPPAAPSNLKSTEAEPIKKKPATAGRSERVSKCCLSKQKNNDKSLCRKSSANENTKSRRSCSETSISTYTRKRRYFGLFQEVASKQTEPVSRDLWEKGTTSILKTENLINKSDSKFSTNDVNKHFVRTLPCLNLHTFDLNKLLPEINGNCTNGA